MELVGPRRDLIELVEAGSKWLELVIVNRSNLLKPVCTFGWNCIEQVRTGKLWLDLVGNGRCSFELVGTAGTT